VGEVRVGGRSVRTDRRGRAAGTVAPARPGRLRVVARHAGCRTGTSIVRVLRAR
jgi:hypothetical protein